MADGNGQGNGRPLQIPPAGIHFPGRDRTVPRRLTSDRRAECATDEEERIEADDDGGDTSPDLLAAAVRAACSAAVERGDRKLTVTVEKVNGQFRGRWNALSEESGEVPLMPEQPPKR